MARSVIPVAPMLRPFIASLVLLSSASIAHAEEQTPLHASITLSPVHFAITTGELTVEVAVAPNFGVAVIGAVGSIKPTTSDQRVLVYEAGISPRYYVWGNFRQGVELGVEALYAHASADGQLMSSLSAEGLALGPYAGYKWVSSMGLTLEAQLGISYFAMRGDGVSDEDSRISPIVNLQVGWSF